MSNWYIVCIFEWVCMNKIIPMRCFSLLAYFSIFLHLTSCKISDKWKKPYPMRSKLMSNSLELKVFKTIGIKHSFRMHLLRIDIMKVSGALDIESSGYEYYWNAEYIGVNRMDVARGENDITWILYAGYFLSRYFIMVYNSFIEN